MRHAQTISVVITTDNRPDAPEAVVRACFMQNDKNFEIIIADDGSTANTRDCLETLSEGAPVRVRHIWQPDRGFRAATTSSRNRLIANYHCLRYGLSG
jgi:glycosyltransferase involved in cell wall biosynthesis